LESLKVYPDNGPHFISEIVQEVSKFLQFTWDLHTPWRPQSSRKVERMNQILRRQISKLCQETQLKWVDFLPFALMRVRITLRVREGVSAFEISYGKPYPVNDVGSQSDQIRVRGGGNDEGLFAVSFSDVVFFTQIP